MYEKISLQRLLYLRCTRRDHTPATLVAGGAPWSSSPLSFSASAVGGVKPCVKYQGGGPGVSQTKASASVHTREGGKGDLYRSWSVGDSGCHPCWGSRSKRTRNVECVLELSSR
jgi:hypothetical protein